MNFCDIYNYTNPISDDELNICKKKFQSALVDLGLNENNTSCGSGLGGNNFQLYLFFNIRHHLTSHVGTSNIPLILYNNNIDWNSNWLLNASKIDIRNQLNNIFDAISEEVKYQSAIITSLSSSNSLRKTLNVYESHFPKLMD